MYFYRNTHCTLCRLQWGSNNSKVDLEKLKSHLTALRIKGTAAALKTMRAHHAQLPYEVSLQAGVWMTTVFTAELLRDTGDRFVKSLLETSPVEGVSAVKLQADDVPAMNAAFELLIDLKLPDYVETSEYLDIVQTLVHCHAWDAIEALNVSLDIDSYYQLGLLVGCIKTMRPSPPA